MGRGERRKTRTNIINRMEKKRRGNGAAILLGFRGKQRGHFPQYYRGNGGGNIHDFTGQIKQSFALVLEGKSSVVMYPCFRDKINTTRNSLFKVIGKTPQWYHIACTM